MGIEIIVIIAVSVGLYMAWNIGANDVANSMACAVGSKSLTLFWAVILAGIFNFLGAVLVGSHVTDTVRKGIIDTQVFSQDPRMLARGMVCALLAAALWLNLATYFGMPVSTTHSIVGAVVGFGILEAGLFHIHWSTFAQIVSSWFISPLAGGAAAFVIFKLISRYILSAEKPIWAARRGAPVCVFFTFAIIILAVIYKGLKNIHLSLSGTSALCYSIIGGFIAAGAAVFFMRIMYKNSDDLPISEQLRRVELMFVPLIIISSSTVSFAQGANDVANAIGPLAAVVEIVKHNSIPSEAPVSIWFLVLGGIGISVGLATLGYRVMHVVGTKVTEITPSRGIAANIAGMATVLTCSKLGLPISTTHTMVGAIIGVGMARGITAIDRKIVGSIFVSWLITVPVAGLLTVLLYLLGQWWFW